MTNEETFERVIATIVKMEDEGKKYLSEYISKDTLITCMNALEKQIPKKVKVKNKMAYCPHCYCDLRETYFIGGGIHWCSHCGNAIYWGE